ncbi:MAG: hypothetical protein ACLFPA_11305 [Dichotomicrobium sp.]
MANLGVGVRVYVGWCPDDLVTGTDRRCSIGTIVDGPLERGTILISDRRVDVERALLAAAAGKRPLPDADECRHLALKLGIPSRSRRNLEGKTQ